MLMIFISSYHLVYLWFSGAGPGAGFTFHGGGHGGVGGGSWVDVENSASYGKSYNMLGHLIGGSSGQFYIYEQHSIILLS